MRRPALAAVLGVALLAALAHGRGVSGGFVYDDHRFVEQNSALDDLDVPRAFTDPSSASASQGIRHDVYRPLRTLDFAWTAAVAGRDRPWPYHLGNILLHALAAVLVVRLAFGLFRSLPAAAAAGALFAVHPVGVECVGWISSRGDLLAVVLMLCALVLLERPGAGRTLLGALAAALACFAKESAVVLPALLVLRDVALPSGRRLPTRTTALRTVLLAALVAGYLAARLSVIPGLDQVAEFPGGSRSAAARGMLAGLAWYAQALAWPTGFPMDLHLSIPGRWSDPEVVLGLGLLVTLLLAGAYGLRRRSVLALATLGALACLVPVSNVLVPLKAVVAERFLYPVLVTTAIGVAGAVHGLPARARLAALAALAAVVAVLGSITWWRTRAWADDLVLWETVLRERPSHMRAYEGLGYEYLRRGRVRDAEIAYRSYLTYNPVDGKAMVQLADLFGETALALREAHDTPNVTVTGEGRRRARVYQLQLYRAALDTWARVGLTTGRGSPEMVRAVHERRLAAAVDLGDLGEAKHANDALLGLEGLEPTDVADVLARAPFSRRAARLDLALIALLVRAPPDLPSEAYALRVAQRAAVLRDVGIDARLADADARARLLPAYRALANDPAAGPAQALNLALLLDALGQAEEAAAVRRRVAPPSRGGGDGR